MKHYLPSDPMLRYMGRIDRSNPDAPDFYWPGSAVQFRFRGAALDIEIENHSYDAGNGNGLSLGVLLDGVQSELLLSPENDTVQTLHLTAGDDGMHRLLLWKRQDGPHHFRLRGIGAEELDVLELPALKIEAFGDSVTAGSWIELTDRVGQSDPPYYTARHDNAWYSYAWETARRMNAQIHLTAQGGIALLDGTGYYEEGRVGMETAYDKLCYQPAAGALTKWDFQRYVPDYVIFAIGQNDHHVGNQDNCIPSPEKRAHWLDVYCGIIGRLMAYYPKAQFVLTLTVLMHDEYWEQLLDEACARINSPRVRRLRFTRSGKATPGHPRVQEHLEMADELTAFLRSL